MTLPHREKRSLNFLQDFLWTDERFQYLQISTQIVTILSLICATSEIIFGCWSLNILSTIVQSRMELSSTKSKHVAIGVALFLTLSARCTILIIWNRSTRNENLRVYSITSHCIFLSIFVILGLGGLVIYFVSFSLDSDPGSSSKVHTEVLLAFIYISGFDILFTGTFAFAVASDLQRKIRRSRDHRVDGRENWVRPCQVSKWSSQPRPFHEVYV